MVPDRGGLQKEEKDVNISRRVHLRFPCKNILVEAHFMLQSFFDRRKQASEDSLSDETKVVGEKR